MVREADIQFMARCPACDSEIDRVIAETIELTDTEAFVGDEAGRDEYAIATLCPACEAIIGI